LSWFTWDDFYDHILEIWNKPVKGQNLVQRWNNKFSALRRHLRWREANDNGQYKAQKQSLQTIINELDLAAELRDLSSGAR